MEMILLDWTRMGKTLLRQGDMSYFSKHRSARVPQQWMSAFD
jgi:hypothetical protein